MPLYEYYCKTCQRKFELLRPMSRADEEAACPQGHGGAERALSLFASFSKGNGGSATALGGSGGCAACSSASCAACGL